MIPILYIFAKRIFKRTDFAFIAAALFAFDCMHFAQTRIATIDGFAVFFILLMYLFMYDYMCMSFYDEPLKKTLKPLFLSGLFFGLGVSVKWIGFYAGAGLAALLFITLGLRLYERIKAKTKTERERTVGCLSKICVTLAACLLFFVTIPSIIYFVSYTPHYIYEASKVDGGTYDLKDCFNTLWKNQQDMFRYHSNLQGGNISQSAWYEWPLMIKSTRFYTTEVGTGVISSISSTGNPIVWYGSTAGVLGLLASRVAGAIKGNKATRTLLIAVLANYLPWVLVPRFTLIYHYFAALPFVLLAALYFLCSLEQRSKKLAWIKWVALAAAIVFFALMYPTISGLPMPKWYAWFLEYCLPLGDLMYGYV